MPNDHSLVVVEDRQALAIRGAAILARALERKKSSLFGLPTGRTPLGLYRKLAELRRAGLDCTRLLIVALDEYLGVGPDQPRSLFRWLRRAALDPLGVTPDRILAVHGDDPAPERACRALDRRLAELGHMDLALLGLGWNGHVAFNEPGARVSSPSRIVPLEAGTIERNRRYWARGAGCPRDARGAGCPRDVRGTCVPRNGITIGMGPLLCARRIVLLVSGRDKARVLLAALRGPMTPTLPASLLRNGSLTVLADRAAAALL